MKQIFIVLAAMIVLAACSSKETQPAAEASAFSSDAATSAPAPAAEVTPEKPSKKKGAYRMEDYEK